MRVRQVDVVVLAVGRGEGEEGEDVCGEGGMGVVRREDVRATEKERVVCGEGFRVGDVVRGVVVSGVSFGCLWCWVGLGTVSGGARRVWAISRRWE